MGYYCERKANEKTNQYQQKEEKKKKEKPYKYKIKRVKTNHFCE